MRTDEVTFKCPNCGHLQVSIQHDPQCDSCGHHEMDLVSDDG